ncbi:HTH HARE-type domain-containing protein [Vibrio crassostreae]|uniref:hypothetical protein n=1 Tax=Vibrio crassostreae TaxID=246167 RepID=UPI001044E5EA|nr:hypothetical protein [Vibrio crassostreae]NOH77857.1 hypothetical protein [Vibrio crassostreae]TCN92681.1 hypothetical protein EDB50_11029 [Vibrio crassostreae]CAK2501707.1 HTH HARE-type domain-containing protein [Vibrio crassostreae]CAK2608275.1 HTH HARE-type domain-containing protein [Vibrio crassostreae]CAK2609103.1 HTH HARE-type domain-containing protein [Vibrio crassostreae]
MTKPDVLRVVEFVINNAKKGEHFSVAEASQSKELNGISIYRIAEILRSTCLEPQGPSSLERLTTINTSTYQHAEQGRWSLNAPAYFGYLTYQSNLKAEQANKHAKNAFWVAIATMVISIIAIFFNLIAYQE